MTQLSPGLRRVSLAGEDVDRLPYAGPGQRVTLLIPRPGQLRPHVDGLITIGEVFSLPDDLRPIMRTYTVRNHRPAAAEVDIDFVVRSDLGPASRWAAEAIPGDEVTIFGPAAGYAPPKDTQWQVIVGDESALPAIAAITESLRHHDRARVIVELADQRDRQRFDTAANLEVSWLYRGSAPSSHLLDAVRTLELPEVPSYFWLAGESSVVTAIRRHLIHERAVSAEDINGTGYWRYGLSQHDA